MEKELVIRTTQNGVEIALLEDKKLVELHQENDADTFKVGDIYFGRVKKVMPGLNAAFVDIGYKKDAFLHYTDLGANFKTFYNYFKPAVSGSLGKGSLDKLTSYPEIDKKGNIREVLKPKTLIPVQVFKEPISSKGPRLTTDFSIAGRFLILTPFSDYVGLSKKIYSAEERKRLKILIQSLKPKNFGVIVRTVAEGKGASELHKDLSNLVQKWETMVGNLKGATYRTKVLSEINKSSTIVRDMLNSDFTGITTTDPVMASELQEYITSVDPNKKSFVKLHKSKTPIFDAFDITRQIKSSFGKTVNYGKGPYLVLEHTEAMHVVDVNSGHKAAMSGDQETNALSVNLGAVDEVARQLRLRDIGGIVVVDFIDMKKAENRKQVLDRMRTLLKKDKATTNALALSKFNLMQITRQRVRPQVTIATKEECPTCAGSGKIEASLLLMDKIEAEIEYFINNNKKFSLAVHPFIAAFITKGFLKSKQWKWFFEYKKWISVRGHENLPITEFRFLDANGDETAQEK